MNACYTLHVVETRASHFDTDDHRRVMADKGLQSSESTFRRMAVVPREGDEVHVGNLPLVAHQVILFVDPRPGRAVARIWFKVKP